MYFLKLANDLRDGNFDDFPQFQEMVKAAGKQHFFGGGHWRLKHPKLFFIERRYLDSVWTVLREYAQFRFPQVARIECEWRVERRWVDHPPTFVEPLVEWRGSVVFKVEGMEPIVFADFKSIDDCTAMGNDVAEKVFAYILSCIANQPIQFDGDMNIVSSAVAEVK